MDTTATLAQLLDRVVDGADGRPHHETTAAILDEAARFAERHLVPLAGRYAALADFHVVEACRKAALLVERCRHDDLDAAFDAAFAA
jgi:hypothetical protein